MEGDICAKDSWVFDVSRRRTYILRPALPTSSEESNRELGTIVVQLARAVALGRPGHSWGAGTVLHPEPIRRGSVFDLISDLTVVIVLHKGDQTADKGP